MAILPSVVLLAGTYFTESRIEEMTFEQIAAHTIPKRAIEIAVAGNHSLLLIGPRGVGKQTLIEGYYDLAVSASLAHLTPNDQGCITLQPGASMPQGFNILIRAAQLCYCGADNLTAPCKCSKRAKARYGRRLRTLAFDFDILVEVCGVPVKEYGSRDRGTTEQAFKRIMAVREKQIIRCVPNGDPGFSIDGLFVQLDESGRRMFELANRHKVLGVGETASVLRVARTIADLAGDLQITARALAEAVQYRWLPICQEV